MSRRYRLAVFVVALLACLSGPNVTNYDSYLAVPVAWSVLRHGDLDLDEYEVPEIRNHHGYVSVDARAYDFYPWPVAMLALPVVALTQAGAALGLWPGVDQLIRDNTMDLMQLITASFITALAAMVMAMVAFERFGGRLAARTAALTGLLFVLATTMWSTGSRALWQHGPAALFVALALLDAQRLLSELRGAGATPTASTTWFRFGAWLALAMVMRPTAAVAGAAIAAAVLWGLLSSAAPLRRGSPIQTPTDPDGTGVLGDPGVPGFAGVGQGGSPNLGRRVARLGRGPLWAGVGAGTVMVPFLVLNISVFGAALPTSYSANRLAVHDQYLEALAANLVSPARGVLISVPLLAAAVVAAILAIRRAPAPAANPLRLACLAGLVVHWLVISAGSFGWWAGHSYGARFFTEVTPLMAYLGLDLVDRVRQPGRWRIMVGVLAAVSVAVQLPGVYLRSTQCWNGDPTDIDADPGRVWSWRAPPFLHAAGEAADGLPLRTLIMGPCPPPGGA
ncbi:MAG: hypothetical protein ACKV2O_05755 [Acidimicrobiales bacterium]